MPHGIVDQPTARGPGGGPPVQPGHPLGAPLLPLAHPQQVGEQAVVAVPAALPVQGNQEQVGPLEVLEQLLAVRAAGDPSLRPLLQQRNALLRQVEAPYLPQEGNGLFVGDSRPGRQ